MVPSIVELIGSRVPVNREVGQTMAEYAVVLAVISLLVIGALTALSTGISGAITSVVGNL